jgi:inner membrane protein
MATPLQTLKGSVTGKVLFIALLVLLLLVPLGMIKGLIQERARNYEVARSGIANVVGASQTIGAPILVVPFQYTQLVQLSPVTVTDELYLLPRELTITGAIETDQRKRGIYSVAVFEARLHVTGRFPGVALDRNYDDLQILWNQAQIALPLTDARSVRQPIVLASGVRTTTFQASGERVAGFGPQLVARYAELGLGALTAPQAFSFDLVVAGTGSVRFLPLGDETRVSIASTWPSPSLVGAYLPQSPVEPTADGFTAEWRVLDLGRGYPSRWQRSGGAPRDVAASAFGADLITPVGVHEATLRATKHAGLIIGLTFAAYFLFELFAALRLHALQYLLIGMANTVFYLLLLALAEHIGFGAAYAASAVAATALITSYSGAILRSLRRAAPVGALLTVLYAYLYVTLKAEDYALLFGAFGVFAVLASFMYLTRHVDWFTVSFGARSHDNPRVQLHA